MSKDNIIFSNTPLGYYTTLRNSPEIKIESWGFLNGILIDIEYSGMVDWKYTPKHRSFIHI